MFDGPPAYGNPGQPQFVPQGQAPYGWTGQPLTPEQAAAQARAAKAQRPWFKKKRFVLPIGTGVKSGDFKITISKVREGGKMVGSEYANEKAQGHFVLVDIKAKNNGDRAGYFSSGDIKLVDAKGREFSVNEMASIYVSDSNPLLEEINPGNTSKGTFAFDLPKGVDAVQAQISAGGLFDSPVTVELG